MNVSLATVRHAAELILISSRIYNYISHGTNNTSIGPFPGTPGFSDTYVGEGYGIPVIGASGFGNPASTADGFYYNQTGVNNLLV